MTYVIPEEQTSPKFGRAFAVGCQGPTTADLSTLQDGPFAAFCTPRTWPLLDQAMHEGRDYYYGDHGWFRRGKYYRVAKNAVQYQPTDQALKDAKPFRYDLLPREIAPTWNRDGSAIIICPNSVEYMRRFGVDAQQWTLDLAHEISAVSNRPIIIRWKATASRRPLYVDLHDAYCVVVFSSGAAVEALQAGIPIVTLASWATTRRMGATSISAIGNKSLVYPDELLPFLWCLSERQFTLPEFASGLAWRVVNTDRSHE